MPNSGPTWQLPNRASIQSSGNSHIVEDRHAIIFNIIHLISFTQITEQTLSITKLTYKQALYGRVGYAMMLSATNMKTPKLAVRLFIKSLVDRVAPHSQTVESPITYYSVKEWSLSLKRQRLVGWDGYYGYLLQGTLLASDCLPIARTVIDMFDLAIR